MSHSSLYAKKVCKIKWVYSDKVSDNIKNLAWCNIQNMEGKTLIFPSFRDRLQKKKNKKKQNNEFLCSRSQIRRSETWLFNQVAWVGGILVSSQRDEERKYSNNQFNTTSYFTRVWNYQLKKVKLTNTYLWAPYDVYKILNGYFHLSFESIPLTSQALMRESWLRSICFLHSET